MMHRIVLIVEICVAIALGFAPTSSALPVQIFFDDFETSPIAPQWSDTNRTTATASPPLTDDAALGFYHGDYTLGQSTTLALSGLPAHTQLALSFDLYLFATWDGENLTFGKDFFSLSGDISFSETFTNHQPQGQSQAGTPDETYGSAGPSQTHVYRGLGPTGSSSEFLIPHSSSSFTVTFGGPTTQADEWWGIDNVRVTIDAGPQPVPEPSALTFLGTGLAGLYALRFRRKRRR